MNAAGSRARSREIGYAEAMADMSCLLESEARRWKNSAAQQIIPHAEAALRAAAGQLQQLADYARGVAQVHGTEHAIPVGELLIDILWQPGGCNPVPVELPRQSDNHPTEQPRQSDS